jgi:sulfonate transport system ATP-binding protein
MSVDITISGFAKSFGTTSVLRDLDLTIPAGQFVAVVGKSGCGKSTLLRSIAGLESPTAGTLAIDDTTVSGPNEHVRVMFQDDRLLPWRTVLDNVSLVTDDPAKAEQALAAVGLTDKGGVWPSELSGGQRQRVSLARALVSAPKVILFDEPLGALDAFTRIEMQALIETLWRDQGFTSVLVTHDVSEAVAVADRVIVLADGGIALDVEIDLPRPRTRNQNFFALEEQILSRIIHQPGVPS